MFGVLEMTDVSFDDLHEKLAKLLEIFQASTSQAGLESSFLKTYHDDNYEGSIEDAMIEFVRTGEDRYLELYHAFLMAVRKATPSTYLYEKLFNMGLKYLEHTSFKKEPFANRIKLLVNKVKFQGKEYTPEQLINLIEKADMLKRLVFDFMLNPEAVKDEALREDKSVKKYIEFELNK